MSDNIAHGLGDLMRQAQASFEDDELTTPSSVADAVRSRRRRSVTLLGTVAGVACLALGVGGIGLATADGSEAVPSFTASPSPVPSEDLTVPLATVTIPIDGGPQYDGVESLLECGAPAPQPTGTVEKFSVAIAQPDPLTLPVDVLRTGENAYVNTWITYDSDEEVPVAQTPVTLVLVKDGKVAGHFRTDDNALRYWTYNDSELFSGGSTLMPLGDFCPEVSGTVADADARGFGLWPDDPARVLDPGEYQLVPVARVWANEEAAALKLLYRGGITVIETPQGEDSVEYLPGSWDCEQAVEFGQSPRSCLGDASGGAIVDVSAGTVTLPFEVDQLTKTFDLTLVGEPVDLSIPEPFEVPHFDSYSSKPLDVSDPIECGTTFDYTTPEAPLMLGGSMPRSLGLGAGAFNSTNGWVMTTTSGAGELVLERGAKAWLVADVAEDYNYFQERPGNQHIVGVAEFSLTGGNTVAYDRYDGPTMVDMVFTNVTLCDDFNSDLGVDAAIVDAMITITPEGESPEEPTRQLLYVR